MLNQHNVSFISVFILLRRWYVIWQVLFQKLRLSSFLTLFSVTHRHLEDVFLGAPTQDRAPAKLIVWLVLEKKTLSCLLCHASDSVCFTANTQMTNLSFQLLVRRRSLFLFFLDSSSLFLLDWLGTHLFGRALTRSHKLLFLPKTTFLDAFLKKRMAPPSWKPEGIAKCRLEICNWVVRN